MPDDKGYKDSETAFLYSDGKLYLGQNHIDLMQAAELSDQWGTATRWHEPHSIVLGWIWNNKEDGQTAEFYSDFYQNAQDSSQFDKVYKMLQSKFPKLNNLTFGPDKDTWEEMKKEPDWMEQYLPEKEASVDNDPMQMVRTITNFAADGKRPDEETLQEITDNAHKVRHLSPEELRHELDVLLASQNPAGAIQLADECGLLDYLIPELGAAYDFNQNNPHHAFSVGDHSLAVLRHAQQISDDPDVRLAALLHDIGKPDTYWEDPFGNGHFYADPSDPNSEDHESRGADLAAEFMQRLGYPQDRINKVENLISNHGWGFYSTLSGARRFVNRAGSPDAASNLLDLREADLKGKSNDVDPEGMGQLEMSRAIYDKFLQGEQNDPAIN